MHAIFLAGLICSSLLLADSSEAPSALHESRMRETCDHLLKLLPSTTLKNKAARLELERGFRNIDAFCRFQRQSVKTKDGATVNVVTLNRTSNSHPGTDFSIVFLLFEGRIIDWSTCKTATHWDAHCVLLEDVDGDGFLDLAFRRLPSAFGLRQGHGYKKPGDARTWHEAYAITKDGRRSFFSEPACEIELAHRCDPNGDDVILKIKDLPASIPGNMPFACTVSATNQSSTAIPIKRYEWFCLDAPGTSLSIGYGPIDLHTTLQPGETVSQQVILTLEPGEKSTKLLELHLAFRPQGDPTFPEPPIPIPLKPTSGQQ